MGSPSADDPKAQRRWGLWKGKLLVVDEDVEDLQHYSAILNQLGYEVRTFASYGEAVACLGRPLLAAGIGGRVPRGVWSKMV